MQDFTITPISSLRAEFSVPGDKSVSHRAAILTGLASGVSTIRNFLPSEDCLNTLAAMRALGVEIETPEAQPGVLRVHGRATRLSPPAEPLDCGNSGTTMRLLAGLLAAQPFTSELSGDSSLSARPMNRIIEPLGAMGARIEARGAGSGCAPLRVNGGPLHGIRYEMPVASAQVKSAILLAGMSAEGETTVVQPAASRDHTERMMESFGVGVRCDGLSVSIRGKQVPSACDFTVPGDISSGAFWLAAAAALPGSQLRLCDIGLNPSRTAVLKVLGRMGARIREAVHSTTGEPIGHIEIEGAGLNGTELSALEIPNLIDEIPVIAVAAALARGSTVIRNARELRVKETDRITAVVENLRRMGASVEEHDDGMTIHGGQPLQGAVLDSYGDHRIAMAFAIAGLFASGQTIVRDTACVNISYPGFGLHLAAVTNHATAPGAFVIPAG